MRYVIVSILSLTLGLGAQAAPADRLAKVVADVERDFPDITHVSPDELADRLAQGGEAFVLLDVREDREFAVGHLPGAIRVDPGAKADAVLALVKAQSGPAGGCAQVVAYCSVGVRSSILAERARRTLVEAGCPAPQNLRGGVFGWHNEGRALEDAAGETALVHPYDRTWGKLLSRQDAVASKPAGE